MQDEETSKIPIYVRCRNIKNTDMSKMQKHQKYRYEQDAET
jgi:replication-associated recombination protein RarA